MPPQNRANNLSSINGLKQGTAHRLVQDKSYAGSKRGLQVLCPG